MNEVPQAAPSLYRSRGHCHNAIAVRTRDLQWGVHNTVHTKAGRYTVPYETAFPLRKVVPVHAMNQPPSQLTPWSRVLPEKLTGPHLLNKFPAF
jgi:hypothetical protein